MVPLAVLDDQEWSMKMIVISFAIGQREASSGCSIVE